VLADVLLRTRGRVMSRPVRERAGEAADPVPGWWVAVCAAAAMAAVTAAGLGLAWRGGPVLGPVLAIPVALAGIGAPSARLPLAYGAVMLAVTVLFAPFARGAPLWIAAPASVAAAAVLSAAGVVLNRPGRRERAGITPAEQKLATVTSVAEVVQRALLPPLPRRVGPLELEMVYLAAAAEARVGGDLYEVARTPFGIRLVVGDARGKGLGAVEIAASVLGVFREVAHEVYTLAEMARRLDAGLARRPAAGQADGSGPCEEFVTAVLAEIDPGAGSLTVYNCGHPPPILLSPCSGDRRQSRRGRNGLAAPAVTAVEVPSPAPPLRLLPLGDCSAAGRTLPFPAGGALLLYTDGVTEARDPRRRCYPLAARVTELARAGPDGIRPDLLERVREDLLRHAGAPLDDDAALVLVRAPAAWGDQAARPGTGTGSRSDPVPPG
jgi:serine phosphatase RsbU (regulator of sigma subunit)